MSSESTPPNPPTRVLLVDDSHTDLAVIQSLFRQAPGDYEIETATSSHAALQALARKAHDVCLVDYFLDSMRGTDVIRAALAAGSRIPFLLLTGHDQRSLDLEATRAGAVDFIPKGELSARCLERSIRFAIHTRRTEERLRKQESLAQIGQLAAVVAHEVRNALAGIGGALQMIRKRLPEGAEEREVTDDIQTRLSSLNEMVEDLLLVARPMEPQLAHVKLEAILREIAEEIQGDGGQTIDVSGRAALYADPVLLRRLFHNLCRNARECSWEGGRVRIEMEADDQVARILVKDGGAGVPEELRERVFEPFFSTRSQGAGLGLSIAQRVVEAHKGTITLGCPPEGGTTVEVVLPLREPSTQGDPRSDRVTAG